MVNVAMLGSTPSNMLSTRLCLPYFWGSSGVRDPAIRLHVEIAAQPNRVFGTLFADGGTFNC
jgi:hypothetical protein